MNNYDDIIGLPHFEPKRHKRMPIENRAAQFAPFAALSGHDDAIAETARLTDKMIEVSPDDQQNMSRQLLWALERQTPVTITYFEPDPSKSGGSYLQISDTIKKFDEIEHKLILRSGRVIELSYIQNVSPS